MSLLIYLYTLCVAVSLIPRPVPYSGKNVVDMCVGHKPKYFPLQILQLIVQDPDTSNEGTGTKVTGGTRDR